MHLEFPGQPGDGRLPAVLRMDPSAILLFIWLLFISCFFVVFFHLAVVILF